MNTSSHKDITALWIGIAFCFLVTLAIWLFGTRLEAILFLPDEGYHWYFWKLPQKTLGGWWSAWGLYVAHQIASFSLIYYAQTRVRKYTTGLHPVNIWALAINGLFVLLHFLQTHIWYDGLAQDHPPQYPQYSVILLLVWVLLMENQRRGLLLGMKVPIGKQISSFARKYHGYVFSLAIIYTFWYHPMHPSLSHLSGFLYTLLIMLQSSLFFTRIHTNRYWTLTQEVLVLIHATIVAYFQGLSLWPMFLFGFAGIFVLTQMHGIGLSRVARTVIGGGYVASVILVYNTRGFEKIAEIIRIPLADYILVGVLALILGGGIFCFNLLSGRTQLKRKP
jgi:hypothetical protein